MKEHPADPKDKVGKVPGFTYAWMIPYLTVIARRHGYALAFHGSMSRDLDVVAVPWVDDANDPLDLLSEMAHLTGGRVKRTDAHIVQWDDVKNPEHAGLLCTEKPHGRRAYTIIFKSGWHFIDLSVMPKTL